MKTKDFKASLNDIRHYVANRKIAGSIPDEVIFLNLPNPSGSTRPWGLLSL
jgi:hypothetical protein